MDKEDLETLALIPTKVTFPAKVNIIKAVAGDTFTLALDSNGLLFLGFAFIIIGHIWSWGNNLAGQLGYETPGIHQMSITPRKINFPKHIIFSDVSAGASHALAIRG